MASQPGTRALWIGGGLVVVFGIITLAVWSQGGPLWKGSIPVVLGLVLFAIGLRARVRSLLLWRKGDAVEGQVVHAWTKTTMSNAGEARSVSHLVQYEYVVDGQQYSAQHGTGSLWEEGPIWVIYDRRNPAHSMPTKGN